MPWQPGVGGIGIATGANINYATGHASVLRATHGFLLQVSMPGLIKMNPSPQLSCPGGNDAQEALELDEAADLIIASWRKTIASKVVTTTLRA